MTFSRDFFLRDWSRVLIEGLPLEVGGGGFGGPLQIAPEAIRPGGEGGEGAGVRAPGAACVVDARVLAGTWGKL